MKAAKMSRGDSYDASETEKAGFKFTRDRVAAIRQAS